MSHLIDGARYDMVGDGERADRLEFLSDGEAAEVAVQYIQISE